MASLGSEVGDGGRQKSRAEKAHTSGLAGGVSSDAHYLSVLYLLYLQYCTLALRERGYRALTPRQ